MNNKTLMYVVLAGVIAFIAYSVYQDAQANPAAYKPPPAPVPGQPRTLLQSINDLSYNLLFGWWLGH